MDQAENVFNKYKKRQKWDNIKERRKEKNVRKILNHQRTDVIGLKLVTTNMIILIYFKSFSQH